jgi:hypothetical protein
LTKRNTKEFEESESHFDSEADPDLYPRKQESFRIASKEVKILEIPKQSNAIIPTHINETSKGDILDMIISKEKDRAS